MSVAQRAKAFYKSELQSRLEAEHAAQFAAIQQEARSHFIGDTFIAAALSAKEAHPGHKSFVIRIGYEAAFHIGASST